MPPVAGIEKLKGSLATRAQFSEVGDIGKIFKCVHVRLFKLLRKLGVNAELLRELHDCVSLAARSKPLRS